MNDKMAADDVVEHFVEDAKSDSRMVPERSMLARLENRVWYVGASHRARVHKVLKWGGALRHAPGA
jgi:hypothetical protein